MMQGKGKNSPQTPRSLVRTYIRAKDENRPHLTARVFSETAELEIIVKPGTISFPSLTKGLKSITDVLVRSFSMKYENIYTFCLKRPKPQTREKGFSCDWLVGMSEREGGHVRVGCGRYDWRFFPGERYLVDRLVITIEVMQVLAPVWNKTVFEWLSGLPYPWCPGETIAGTAPVIGGIEAVTDYVTRRKKT